MKLIAAGLACVSIVFGGLTEAKGDAAKRLTFADSDVKYEWRRQELSEGGLTNTYLHISSAGAEGIRCQLTVQLASQDYPLTIYSDQVYTYDKVSVRSKEGRFSKMEFENIELPFRGQLSVTNCEFVRPKEMIEPSLPNYNELTQSISGVVSYLKETQVKKDQGEDYLMGEWGSRMVIRKNNFIIESTLGEVGKDRYDSNCFETSATHNELAALYLQYGASDPILNSIPDILNLALKKVMVCKGDKGFGFWPYITMPEKWRKPGSDRPTKLRGPKHFDYKYYWVQLLSHNLDDSDDTALSYMAIKLNDQVASLSGHSSDYINEVPNEIGPIFSEYRSPRQTKHRNGAFQTWLGDKSKHLLAIGDDKKVMPFDSNIVDCVVVSNILRTLSAYGEMSTPGVAESCNFVNEMVREGRQFSCGDYYPNKYTLHLSVAKAIKDGVSCLEKSRKTLVSDIEKNQLTDGSWNTYDLENDDVYQSTSYAMSAYLTFNSPVEIQEDSSKRALVLRATDFFLSKKRVVGNHIYWPAGNHFSGGTLFGMEGIRNNLVWRSRGFTNSLILHSLFTVREALY